MFFLNFFLSSALEIAFEFAPINSILYFFSSPVFSVQYHPESNPGPQDSVYLFEEFIKSMKKNAKKKRH